MPRLTSKGQVTIPKVVRDRFGLGPGSEVEFDVQGDLIVVRKASREAVLRQWEGAIALPDGVDAFVSSLRGDD